MNRDENFDTDIAELTPKAHRVREALAAIKDTGERLSHRDRRLGGALRDLNPRARLSSGATGYRD